MQRERGELLRGLQLGRGHLEGSAPSRAPLASAASAASAERALRGAHDGIFAVPTTASCVVSSALAPMSFSSASPMAISAARLAATSALISTTIPVRSESASAYARRANGGGNQRRSV